MVKLVLPNGIILLIFLIVGLKLEILDDKVDSEMSFFLMIGFQTEIS
jgi:hypothetical protein